MKKTLIFVRFTVVAFAFILLLTACTSMTQIQSIPPGAKIYVNEEFCGETPYTLSDNKIIGSTSLIRIEKSGYKLLTASISKMEELDPAPLICGFIFTPIWWLWAMKYKPIHLYELVPLEQ